MGERIKFAFGHVIAFVALIYICYITFMSLVYVGGSNVKGALAAVGIYFIVVLWLLMYIQALKCKDRNFKANIWKERVGVVALCVVIILSYIPFQNFWSVQSRSGEIEGAFRETVDKTREMFDIYDIYAQKRIDDYGQTVTDKCDKKPRLARTMKDGLEIQLRPEAYKLMRSEADEWLKTASDSSAVSVWNVFLLGNMNKMDTTVGRWHEQLATMSEHKMIDEPYETNVFDPQNAALDSVRASIKSTLALYRDNSFTPVAPLAAIPALFLFLPYFIQHRHTKSTYTLCGRSKTYLESNHPSIEGRESKRIKPNVHSLDDIGGSKVKGNVYSLDGTRGSKVKSNVHTINRDADDNVSSNVHPVE